METESQNEKLISAWRKAAIDLDLKIRIKYILEANDQKAEFLILVENFGSEYGTLILTTDNMEDFNWPQKLGFYVSALNPASYVNYDRDIFIETLVDWGYYGKVKEIPTWYN